MKLCEDCGEKPAIRKQRYCKACRGSRLLDMKRAGYLEEGGRDRSRQLGTTDQTPKAGNDPSPYGENAIRAMEGD